jgi:hypothetical protein
MRSRCIEGNQRTPAELPVFAVGVTGVASGASRRYRIDYRY